MINDHRRFLYQKGVESGRIFECGEEIPDGWTDLPDSDEWDNMPGPVESPEEPEIEAQEPIEEPEIEAPTILGNGCKDNNHRQQSL